MDAKQLGPFIADRRKELGLTQSLLAEKLHVTDKAVSRWERGIGLPDITNMEALADALEISLIELMQARRNESEHMPTEEAERLLIDTIHLSKATGGIPKIMGGAVLAGFAIVSLLLLLLLISDGKIVLFSVGSIITGLIAWGIPIWQLSFSSRGRAAASAISSLGFALTSLSIQFLQIAEEVHTGDWSALIDTIDALVLVVVLFIFISMLLNIISVIRSMNRRRA